MNKYEVFQAKQPESARQISSFSMAPCRRWARGMHAYHRYMLNNPNRNKHRAVALAVIGVFGLMYLLRSWLDGAINLGGRSNEFIVRFAESPVAFVAGSVVIAALSVGSLYLARRDWQQSVRAQNDRVN
jgi:hypothetical protein